MEETKYKQTEIGLIPEDWECSTFGVLLRFLPTNTLAREFLGDKGNIKNIHYGDVLIKYGNTLDAEHTHIPYIDESKLPAYRPKNFAKDGDIIIADTAEDETVCKATELWNVGQMKIVSGLHTMWCRPQSGVFAIKYLGYFINSSTYHNQILPLIQGIKVSSVSKRDIQQTWVLIPPLAEQHAIASALTSIDNLIASLDKQIAKTQSVKQGAMQQLLTGLNSEMVEYKKLGDICISLPKETLKTTQLKDSGYPVVNSGKEYYGYYSSYNNEGNAITIASRGDAGYVKYIEQKFWAGGLCYPYRSINEELYATNYLYFYLKGKEKAIMDDLVERTSIPALNKADVELIEIPIPSIETQHRIASALTAIDDQISALEAKRKKYEMVKVGMMQQLLTGRIRLK